MTMNVKPAHLKPTRIGLVLFFLLLFFLPTTVAAATSVTLRWDANNPAPEGYRVFARRGDQFYDYSRPAWEGTATTCTIDNLEDLTEYYFVVRAYDGYLESIDSEEVRYPPQSGVGSAIDATPPYWTRATNGIGLVATAASDGEMIVEFDSAWDSVDGGNLKFNLYYAPDTVWDDDDWSGNSVVADAVVLRGNSFANAVVIDGLTIGVSYTFGVRVEDQSGNEDSNTQTLKGTPGVSSAGRLFDGRSPRPSSLRP